jgi:hypothetical protein
LAVSRLFRVSRSCGYYYRQRPLERLDAFERGDKQNWIAVSL